MEVKNYYELLGIETTSDLDGIKKAFRSKIAIYHPDINTSKDAGKHFDDLVEAFDILSKPDKRKLYDKLLNNNKAVTARPSVVDLEKEETYQEWKKEAKQKSEKYKKKNLDDSLTLEIFGDAIFEGLFDGAGDLLEGAGDIIGDILGDILS